MTKSERKSKSECRKAGYAVPGFRASSTQLTQLTHFTAPVSAFSLIEVLGVMAVAMIIILALSWTTIKSLDVTYNNQEAANLQNFANAMQNSILRNRYIPGSNDWYSVIGSVLGLNSNAVAQTSRRTGRVFMIDPNLQ